MKKNLITIVLISFLFLPAVCLALELDYPSFGGYEVSLDMDLNQLVAWFYYLIVATVGLSAFIMLIWGGFEWLTSAGDTGKLGNAKDRMSSAILGLLIVLGSWLILQVINPDLLILNLSTLP